MAIKVPASIVAGAGKPFTSRASHYIGPTILAITRQLLQLVRCSNPLRIQQDFLFRVKKNFSFGFVVLLGGRCKWWCFHVFMVYFTRPWTPIEWPNILAQVCFKI